MKLKTLLIMIAFYTIIVISLTVYTEHSKLDQPLFADHYIYREEKDIRNAYIYLYYVTNLNDNPQITSISDSSTEKGIEFNIVSEQELYNEGRYTVHELLITPHRYRKDFDNGIDLEELQVTMSDGSRYVTKIGHIYMKEKQDEGNDLFHFVSTVSSNRGLTESKQYANKELIVHHAYVPFLKQIQANYDIKINGDLLDYEIEDEQLESGNAPFHPVSIKNAPLMLDEGDYLTVIAQLMEQDKFIAYDFPVSVLVEADKKYIKEVNLIQDTPRFSKESMQELLKERGEQP
ncbi:hypothetical protein [Bacillus solimangrovi]|uniref:Uncharacterized protein n=1 Tax=Bacillus solimangrovi TaxID=1305675 RepID=A0A1E5LFP6_9BACI|nr:hypothetical protein [Bacillus solimangrovi]OEH92908.1 hypothetical protein BFG57_14640 [Bacillus solimangrovi]